MELLKPHTYELPLSKDYVKHWGLPEAVRELIQNALDCESPFEFEFDGGALYLYSRFENLHPSTLLLGKTSKADNDEAIGNFGEGYKIAMLVLTRLGYECQIRNGDRLWTPKFIHNKQFNEETLCIIDQKAKQANEGVTFVVSGLNPEDITAIRESCLQMQGDIDDETKSCSKGEIIMSRPGKLYVGGLFICDTDLEYGYNIKPEFIKLERDRQTVSGWDLKQITSDMWEETEEFDFIAEMMENEVADVEAQCWGSSAMVKEACYRRFRKEYPEAVIATSQQELDDLVAEGLTDVRYVGNSHGYRDAILEHTTQQPTAPKVREKNTPTAFIDEWFEHAKKHMRRRGRQAVKKLREESKHWTRK